MQLTSLQALRLVIGIDEDALSFEDQLEFAKIWQRYFESGGRLNEADRKKLDSAIDAKFTKGGQLTPEARAFVEHTGTGWLDTTIAERVRLTLAGNA